MPTQNTNSLLQTDISVYEPFTLVRSGVFHFIDVSNDEKDIYTSSTKLESRPNIIYYIEGSETKAMLDYSNASDQDKSYLNILCNNLNNFSGLSLSNAVYLDEKAGIINKSLVSNLLFREYKNNILFTKVLSSVDSGDINKVFYGDYFIDIPLLTTDSSWSNKTAETYSLIINSNPKTSVNFDTFSIVPGDLIEIINPNSLNTQQRFEILQYKRLNNKQIIKLKTPAITENLIGSSTILNFYTKTKTQNFKSLNLDNTSIGCCQDLKTKKTYDNATEEECNIRTNGVYYYAKDQICNSITSPTPIPTITVNSTTIEIQKAEFVLYDETTLEELYISISNNKFLINGNDYTAFALQQGKIYKIIQNDESNLGLPIRLSRQDNTQTPNNLDYYYYDVYGSVRPEGIGSELYLKVTPQTASVLFFFTEKDLTITSPLLFNT
jgi:hypothetical protein